MIRPEREKAMVLQQEGSPGGAVVAEEVRTTPGGNAHRQGLGNVRSSRVGAAPETQRHEPCGETDRLSERARCWTKPTMRRAAMGSLDITSVMPELSRQRPGNVHRAPTRHVHCSQPTFRHRARRSPPQKTLCPHPRARSHIYAAVPARFSPWLPHPAHTPHNVTWVPS